MPTSLPLLADTMDVVSIVFWSFVIIAMIFGAYVGYGWLKAWMKEDDMPAGLGFTLGDLRALHKQGKMTDAEYEKARSKMVASAKKVTDAMPNVMEGRRRPPPPTGGV